MTPVVYLHGFASGPSSTKARFFAQRFATHGVGFKAPDLAEGRFSELTLSAQLRVIDRTVGERTVHLMGSSMGGYLAALFAAAHPDRVAKAVLMAPAFDFAARWRERLGPADFAAWERTGGLPVYHYGEGRTLAVGFALYTDALAHPAFPAVTQPTLIFHGVHDVIVPSGLSERFAELRPNARLRLFKSGHELTDVTEAMWEDAWAFFQD